MRSEISCHPELCLKKAGLTFRAYLCSLPSVCLWAEHCCNQAWPGVPPLLLLATWPPRVSVFLASLSQLLHRIGLENQTSSTLNPLCTPHVQGHWLFYPLTSNLGFSSLCQWVDEEYKNPHTDRVPLGKVPYLWVSPCTSQPLGRGKDWRASLPGNYLIGSSKDPEEHRGSLFSVAVNVLCIFMAVVNWIGVGSEAEGLDLDSPLQ